MNTKPVTLNEEQRLYVIPCGDGYTCLGFDVCEKRAVALARELAALGEPIPQPEPVGTLGRYQQYRDFCDRALAHNRATGWRSKSELTPELVGYEGKQVEVRHRWGKDKPIEVVRFIVGKSTGWIPCHLELETKRSTGGGAVCLGEILSVRAV